jgi:hypothetical protein
MINAQSIMPVEVLIQICQEATVLSALRLSICCKRFYELADAGFWAEYAHAHSEVPPEVAKFWPGPWSPIKIGPRHPQEYKGLALVARYEQVAVHAARFKLHPQQTLQPCRDYILEAKGSLQAALDSILEYHVAFDHSVARELHAGSLGGGKYRGSGLLLAHVWADRLQVGRRLL